MQNNWWVPRQRPRIFHWPFIITTQISSIRESTVNRCPLPVIQVGTQTYRSPILRLKLTEHRNETSCCTLPLVTVVTSCTMVTPSVVPKSQTAKLRIRRLWPFRRNLLFFMTVLIIAEFRTIEAAIIEITIINSRATDGWSWQSPADRDSPSIEVEKPRRSEGVVRFINGSTVAVVRFLEEFPEQQWSIVLTAVWKVFCD